MNKILKNSLVAMSLIIAFTQVSAQQEDNLYGKNESFTKFTAKERKFDSWSFHAYGGVPLLVTGDFKSITNDKSIINDGISFGGEFSLAVEKQLTHVLGLMLQLETGQTKQHRYYSSVGLDTRARTGYTGLSLLGDVNLSSIMRRVDNKSEYNWSLHGYGGFGTYAIDTRRRDLNKAIGSEFLKIDKTVIGGTNSWITKLGFGIRRKMTQNFDLEFRGMYNWTNSDLFDGSGLKDEKYNVVEGNDNFISLQAGIIYRVGKHKEHLSWYDPLQVLYAARQDSGCKQGDNDGDSVCDDWDKELDTPVGARVDGAGVSLDFDKDGVIDFLDKCPAVAGLSDNEGCPAVLELNLADLLSNQIKGIQFALGSSEIREQSYTKLDNAAQLLKDHPTEVFVLEGHTDASGDASKNQTLSEARANSVMNYLTYKGVLASQLSAVGKGESSLLNPECNPAKNCSNAKNEANRRVVFVQKK